MAPITADMPLVLASTSRYRAELLGRLRLPFIQDAPGVDEAECAGEAPGARARRLALEKAQAVQQRHPGRWVIGSDQVAAAGHTILHKPGTAAANIALLTRLSGQPVVFHTAIALVGEHRTLQAEDITTVRFRQLTAADVERYVAAEPAWDCAGGFKVEGLGITLFEEVSSLDPTALVGLPLIALTRLLRDAGLMLP